MRTEATWVRDRMDMSPGIWRHTWPLSKAMVKWPVPSKLRLVTPAEMALAEPLGGLRACGKDSLPKLDAAGGIGRMGAALASAGAAVIAGTGAGGIDALGLTGAERGAAGAEMPASLTTPS